MVVSPFAGEMAWRLRTSAAAPSIPMPLIFTVSRFLANDNASSDALLCLADALDEVANIALLSGWLSDSQEFRRLADLPRELGPLRAALACDAGRG